MADILLPTKLFMPPSRRELVNRTRLLAILHQFLSGPESLAVISGPAGSGKSTLAAEWLRTTNFGQAWLSLDELDNDPLRFWKYFVAALECGGIEVSRELRLALDASQLPPCPVLTALLVDSLMTASKSVVLVIDDYHLICSDSASKSSIHLTLDSLLDRLPQGVKVVIVTRSEPPLSLARRRVKAQLTEIDWDGLRFDPSEARAFLSTFIGDLGREDVEVLYAKTEGWAAGLQLAALSISRSRDPHGFVERLSGNDRLVSDYLLQEVFCSQSFEVQEFMLKTSILDRLNDSLCDAVTGIGGSQTILEYLERTNLFLISQDNHRNWYRYHHLFAGMLRDQLNKRFNQEPDELKLLFHKACMWYESEDYIEEAVSLAVNSPYQELAGDILDRQILNLFFKCDYSTIMRWLESLLPDTILNYPLLCAVYGNVLVHSRSFSKESLPVAESWLKRAIDSLNSGYPCIVYDRELTESFCSLSYAYLAFWRKDPPEVVVARAKEALATLPDNNPSYRRLYSGLQCNLGMSYANLGNRELALQAFNAAQEVGAQCGDYLNAYTAVAYKCYMLIGQCCLPQAANLCRHALANIGRGELDAESMSPFASATHILLAGIFVEWNELEVAGSQLEKGLRLSKMAPRSSLEVMATTVMTRYLAAKGELDKALRILDETQAAHPDVFDVLEAHRMKLFLASPPYNEERLDAFGRWASRFGLGSNSSHTPSEDLVVARVLIALRQAGRLTARNYAEVTGLGTHLETIIESAARDDQSQLLMEALIVQCLARLADGDQPGALQSLVRSLSLACRGGYVRIYIDEGPPMQALISALLGRHRRQVSSPQWYPAMEYAAKLQSFFRPVGHLSVGQELLFPREHEVLSLLADGLTNDQIAGRLFISVNTVKKHLTNIFGKIGATNRQEAVDIARDLGLLKNTTLNTTSG